MANASHVFIDGENFAKKTKELIRAQKNWEKKYDFTQIRLRDLLNSAISGKLDRFDFYSAKLHAHSGSIKKSDELIARQRALKARLERQGIKFTIAGNVRGQQIGSGKTARIIFREKGVDVKLAVDMVSRSCDKRISRAILCSSDSDFQPAVTELKQRKVEVVYVGFENNPNKGLVYTADRAILLRDKEILKACEITAGV